MLFGIPVVLFQLFPARGAKLLVFVLLAFTNEDDWEQVSFAG